MLDRLDSPERLRARTRRTLIAGCALAAAVLAPLIDELILGRGLEGGRPDPSHHLAYAMWAPMQAALLGGLAAALALRAPSWLCAVSTLGSSAVAGVLHCAALFLAPLPIDVATHGVAGFGCLGTALGAGVFGAILSAPMGLAFGLLFLFVTLPGAWLLGEPSHDGPAWASCIVAGLLALASLIAFGLGHVFGDAYWRGLVDGILPALGIGLTDDVAAASIAWVLPLPLALGAVVLALHGLLLHARIARTTRALRGDRHPCWSLAPWSQLGAETLEAVPLRAWDRFRGTERVVEREASPYRSSASTLTMVFVPARAPRSREL